MGGIKQGPFLEGGFFEHPHKTTLNYPIFTRPYVWYHLNTDTPVKGYCHFVPCHVPRWEVTP